MSPVVDKTCFHHLLEMEKLEELPFQVGKISMFLPLPIQNKKSWMLPYGLLAEGIQEAGKPEDEERRQHSSYCNLPHLSFW